VANGAADPGRLTGRGEGTIRLESGAIEMPAFRSLFDQAVALCSVSRLFVGAQIIIEAARPPA